MRGGAGLTRTGFCDKLKKNRRRLTMDEQMMRLALELAAEAGAEGEVPVGAVVTLGDRKSVV